MNQHPKKTKKQSLLSAMAQLVAGDPMLDEDEDATTQDVEEEERQNPTESKEAQAPLVECTLCHEEVEEFEALETHGAHYCQKCLKNKICACCPRELSSTSVIIACPCDNIVCAACSIKVCAQPGCDVFDQPRCKKCMPKTIQCIDCKRVVCRPHKGSERARLCRSCYRGSSLKHLTQDVGMRRVLRECTCGQPGTQLCRACLHAVCDRHQRDRVCHECQENAGSCGQDILFTDHECKNKISEPLEAFRCDTCLVFFHPRCKGECAVPGCVDHTGQRCVECCDTTECEKCHRVVCANHFNLFECTLCRPFGTGNAFPDMQIWARERAIEVKTDPRGGTLMGMRWPPMPAWVDPAESLQRVEEMVDKPLLSLSDELKVAPAWRRSFLEDAPGLSGLPPGYDDQPVHSTPPLEEEEKQAPPSKQKNAPESPFPMDEEEKQAPPPESILPMEKEEKQRTPSLEMKGTPLDQLMLSLDQEDEKGAPPRNEDEEEPEIVYPEEEEEEVKFMMDLTRARGHPDSEEPYTMRCIGPGCQELSCRACSNCHRTFCRRCMIIEDGGGQEVCLECALCARCDQGHAVQKCIGCNHSPVCLECDAPHCSHPDCVQAFSDHPVCLRCRGDPPAFEKHCLVCYQPFCDDHLLEMAAGWATCEPCHARIPRPRHDKSDAMVDVDE